MQQYLDSIKLSLKTSNYFGAIAMALTLPDICASVDDKYNKTSGQKYCIWFNKYLADTYKQILHHEKDNVIFGAPECYAARCSFLHQGTNIIKHQTKTLQYADKPAISVNFMSIGSVKYMRNGDILTIDVNFFCENMINAVEKWMIDIKDDKGKCAKISAMLIVHESLESMYAAHTPTH